MVVQEFKRVGDAGEQALKRPAVGADEATKKLGVMKGAVAGIGLQLQDVAVQMQSGTSMFTIVAQQVPQMASNFGAMGVAVGTTIAIVAALAGAFFGLKTEAVKTGDLLQGALSSAFMAGSNAAENYTEKLRNATNEQKEFLKQIAAGERQLAMRDLEKTAGGLSAAPAREFLRGRLPPEALANVPDRVTSPEGRMTFAAQGAANAAIANIIAAAKRGDSATVRQIASATGFMGSPETIALVNKLIESSDAIALADAVVAGNDATVRALANVKSKAGGVIQGLQNQISGARNPLQGAIDSAVTQLGPDATQDEIAKVRALVTELYGLRDARKAVAQATAESAREDAQATRLIEELQRRLGKFEDSRDAFVKRFTNQIDAAIDPSKMAELKRLAGELYDLERQTDIINRQTAARNRQRQYADSVFGDLQRNRNMERDAWERSPLAGVGAARGLMEVARAASDAGAQIEQSIVGAFRSAEDAMVSFITTGKADFKSLIDSMLQDLARLLIRQTIIAPFAGFLGDFFPKAPGTAHTGGIAGEGAIAMSMADYGRARRFHGGGMASDEIPAVLQRGEVVVSRTDARMRGGGQPIMISIDARGATDPAMIARIAREQARRGVVEGLDQANRRRRGGGLLTA